MSKVEKLREKFGDRIRESLGAGEGNTATLVEHPTRNKRYEATKKAKGYYDIRLQDIAADPQHREEFNPDEIEQLAASLNADGLIAPIVVRWDQGRSKYIIIAGERRYRAARLCGWERITCDIKADDISEGEIAELQLAENHARKDLNPIELAGAFQDVIDKNGYTVRDLAKRVGVNETTVTRYVRLLGLPEDVKKKVANGKIPIGIAREAARLNGEKEQRSFIEKALRDGLSATDAQKVASGKKATPKKKRKKKSAPAAQVFKTEHGDVTLQLNAVKNPSYDHLAAMLEEALEEVQHRIKNRVRL
ncbi:MAG: ParB/RepB/Spo0J family partition protein [Planctomycetaceae bacterium]|nr:ParB/RepB/Spo0J family partition protein [Planctomycetaceae bacterium]